MRFSDRMRGVLLVGAALLIPIGFSAAQQLGAADVIKARQEHLKAIGKAAKEISDQLKSGAPDKAVVLSGATTIDKALKELPTWFPKGSGPEAGVKTAAKPEIWAQPEEFHKAYDTAQAAADKFVQVAAAGDPSATGTAFMSLGMACGGCHKPFRVKQENQ
jgi:cytochrome c556